MVGRGVGPNIWAVSLYTDLTGYPIQNLRMGSQHSSASKCGLVQFSSCLFIVPHLKIREKIKLSNDDITENSSQFSYTWGSKECKRIGMNIM
jgi:hypothetical protein